MKIKIDSREKARKDRAKEFYIAKGHDVNVETLDVGDYIFDDNVVFEYKEISDFMSSILNESLFNEAANQSMKYPHHYVIIVGELKRYVTSNWSYARQRDYPKYVHDNYARYYGALRRLRTFTTPIIVDTEKEALWEMLLQAEKCLDGKSKFYSNVTRPVHSQDVVDVVLCSVNGISSKKAEVIRKHHYILNIYDLMNLTVEDFKQVKGIGEKVANNIYDFLHKGE